MERTGRSRFGDHPGTAGKCAAEQPGTSRPIGIAASSCHVRTRLLRDRGVLAGFHADVSLAKVGLTVQALIAFQVRPLSRLVIQGFQAFALSLPQVRAVYVPDRQRRLPHPCRRARPASAPRPLDGPLQPAQGSHRLPHLSHLRLRQPAPADLPSNRMSPAAGGPGQGKQLRPGQQVAGQGHDLAPDLVLGKALEGEVAQPGVLRAADPVLTAGAAAVPQFQVRELAFPRVGGEGGEPCPSTSVNRSCAPGCGRSLRTMTRIPAGQDDRSGIPVMSATHAPSLPARPRRKPGVEEPAGSLRSAFCMSSVIVMPTE